MASLISEARREVFIRRVRLEMARKGLTREALAAQAMCKERTIGNLLAGQSVRDATVAKVARALAIEFESLLDAPAGTQAPLESQDVDCRADSRYGGYMLSAYKDYVGTYVAFRRAFAAPGELFRSVYEIDWDDELNRLRFFELQRFRGVGNRPVSSSHAGGIHISPHTGLIQLLTTYQGALRLATLTKFRMGDNKLRGVILTQSDRELFFQPAVSALYLERLQGRRKSSELERLVGPVTSDDAAFEAASEELSTIERSAIHIAGSSPREVPVD